MMQFAVESVSSQGARLGRILFNGGQGMLETPLCLLYTRVGAAPHLAEEVLGGVAERPPAAMLTLPTLYELPGTEVLAQYKQGIHSFLNQQDHFLYLSVQDPHTPPPAGYNEEKNISVWTNGGRQKVTVRDHLKFVEAIQPNAFECLCDSVPSSGNKLKRIRKSVDRTLKFLDDTLAARASSEVDPDPKQGEDKVLQRCSLLGAIEGSDVLEERKRSAAETVKRPVDGFVLEGFDIEHNTESQKAVIHAITEMLPTEKPRFIHGLSTPVEIFAAVETGVDVFDGSCPYTATERGCALTFPNGLQEQNGASKSHVQSDLQPMEIDLKEVRYTRDFSPVLLGCQCYTCCNHSRAYVHHLLVTKEILANVLLMIHNLSHYLKFFKNLQQSLKSSNYTEFKQSCLSAY